MHVGIIIILPFVVRGVDQTSSQDFSQPWMGTSETKAAAASLQHAQIIQCRRLTLQHEALPISLSLVRSIPLLPCCYVHNFHVVSQGRPPQS